MLLACIICFNLVSAQTNGVVAKTRYDFVGEYGDRGLALVSLKGKYGFIDKKGKEVIPLVYDGISMMQILKNSGWDDAIIYLSVCQNKKWGLIDASNNIIVPCIYDVITDFFKSDYLALAIKNGKYGAIDIYGDIVIPCEYEDLQLTFHWSEKGLPIYAKKQGKFGYIDEKNNILISFKYSTANRFGKYKLAPVSINGKYGFVNVKGEEIIPLLYEFSDEFNAGLAAVVKNGKVGFVDTYGRIIVPFRYTPDYSRLPGCKFLNSRFFEEKGIAAVKRGEKWGLIDKNGKELTEFKYEGHHMYSSEGVDFFCKGKRVYLDIWGNEYDTEEKRHIGRKGAIAIKTDEGDAMTQYKLGNKYYYANEPIKNVKLAFELYYKAAIQGLEKAYYQVAYMYYAGIGVSIDRKEAFKWFMKSAESGDMVGQYTLGQFYQYGTETEKNLDKAAYWYSKSMKQGYEHAAKQLAELEKERVVKPKPSPAKDIAALTWVNYVPTTKQKYYSFRVGVKSNSKIEEVNVYLNGALTRGIIPVVNDGFDMNINRTVALNDGQNTIKVTVRNAGGVAMTEKTVLYNAVKRNSVVQQKRIALVIGNANYNDFDKKLKNPVNDATDVAAKLKNLGFTVICSLDQTQQGMEATINNFGKQAMNYDVALFYYAGHGVRSNGSNYLIPIDANLPEESYVPYKCTNANLVLDLMEKAQCRMKILILDACRNNPFSRSWNRSTSGGGLDIMNAPKGTFIAFSTAPGDVAQDGKIGERNSPYTAALLQTLDVPNLSITDFFQEVLERVATKTNDRQTPWTSNSFRGKFMFNQK